MFLNTSGQNGITCGRYLQRSGEWNTLVKSNKAERCPQTKRVLMVPLWWRIGTSNGVRMGLLSCFSRVRRWRIVRFVKSQCPTREVICLLPPARAKSC
jgi:hypothetical protein